MYNSEYFDFDSPSVDNISIETIAHSLGQQCRYNGHSNKFYSVGEHSVLVSMRVFELTGGTVYPSLCGLLHDASESILSDIPKPLKIRDNFSFYRKQEALVQNMLYKRFTGEVPDKEVRKVVAEADFELLSTEMRQIMSEPPRGWGWMPEPLGMKIKGSFPNESKKMFLDKYYYLKGMC